MRKLLTIIFSILLFISCGNRSKIKKDLEILQSKSITLPTDIKLFVSGNDTLIDSFMDSELKLIVYSDSIACNTCIVSKMFIWYDLVEYAKKFDNRLKYYFIFSPNKNDKNSVRFELKDALLDYPIILDSKGEFEKLNPHLPRNKAMHTFLLDKDNKVILVGNPLHNPKIEEIFYKIVEEKLGKK